MDQDLIDKYHIQFYDNEVWKRTTWMGIETLKYPSDLCTYQDIIWETKPDLILETGSCAGGSALFYASMLDMMQLPGRVITVDVEYKNRPKHPRVEFNIASSIDAEYLNYIKWVQAQHKRCMVILDSDHNKKHVLREMELYAPLVTSGCYMVVEDTNINGHPVFPNYYEGGPWEAVEEYMKTHVDFDIDRSRDSKFLMTCAPGGWLRKK